MGNNFWQRKTIRLRGIEPSDAEHFIRWNLDGERARFLDFVWPPISEASVRAWVEEQSRRKLDNDSFQRNFRVSPFLVRRFAQPHLRQQADSSLGQSQHVCGWYSHWPREPGFLWGSRIPSPPDSQGGNQILLLASGHFSNELLDEFKEL